MLKHKFSFEGLGNCTFELVLKRKEENKDKQEIIDYLETQFFNAQKYMPFCTKHQTCLNPDIDFDRNPQLTLEWNFDNLLESCSCCFCKNCTLTS